MNFNRTPFLEVQMNHQFNPTINLCNIPPVSRNPILTPILSFDDSSYLLPRMGMPVPSRMQKLPQQQQLQPKIK